jgi:heat shock protein HslJ
MTDHGPFVDLAGTWQVEQVGDTIVAAEGAPTVEFAPDGRVRGTGGVNRFTGHIEVIGDDIQFGPLATTRMAGPPAAMEDERHLLAALSGRRTIVMSGDGLVLGDPAGGDGVRLRRCAADKDADR